MDLIAEKYINPFTDFGFKKLFGTEVNKDLLIVRVAEIAKMNRADVKEYEDSLKVYRDWYSVVKTAKREAREEGREEGKIETALKVLKKGLSVEDICDYTDLSKDKIEEIKKIMII